MQNYRSITAALAVALLVGWHQDKQQPAPEPVKPAVIFFLRHAETEPETREKPLRLLSEEGKKRAEALKRLLGHAGVTHLFATEVHRTKDTIAPLAQATGLTTRIIPSRRSADQIKALKELPPGAIAVVAGHSNTLPPLIRRLGGAVDNLDRRGFLAESSHDRVFMLTLGPMTQTQTVELRYGD